MGKKRKRKQSALQKKRKAQKRRARVSHDKYLSKIQTVNALLEEYFNAFGKLGQEYNSVMTDVEKILGIEEHEPFILHGSDNRSGRISEALANTTSRKTKYRLTKLANYISKYERASTLIKDKYGFSGNLDKKQKQIIKMKSALEKLKNDALPNFYEATGVIVSYKKRMSLRKEFSNLKGLKRDSQEYREEYFRIGKLIEDYIDEVSDEGLNQLKRLEDNSVFEDVLPTTLANALRRK